MAVVLTLAARVDAQVPQVVHYQGYLTDVGGGPAVGEWQLVFSLYGQAQGGDALFEETRLVEVVGGAFSVQLGVAPGNPLPTEVVATGNLWLEVAVEGPGQTVVLKPRQQVVSSPYALMAQRALEAVNALALEGHEAVDFVLLEELANLCLAAEDLPALLYELGYLPGAQYSDDDVALYLESNGYMPGDTGYGDEEVAAYLESNGYMPGDTGYGDEQVAAYLEANGYLSGPHYADGDTQVFLDVQGYVSGPHYADGDV